MSLLRAVSVLPAPENAEDVTHGGTLPVLSEADLTRLGHLAKKGEGEEEGEGREPAGLMGEMRRTRPHGARCAFGWTTRRAATS